MDIEDTHTPDSLQETQEPSWDFSYAIGYYQLGMNREAWEQLDDLDRGTQECPEVLSLRGQILLSEEDWSAVVSLCAKASEHWPNVPDFYIQAALAYDKLNQPEAARCVWLAAPESIKATPFYHYNMARCEARLGRFGEARKHVRAAMALSADLRPVIAGDPYLLAFASDPSRN